MAIAFGAITAVSATTGTSLSFNSPSVSGSDTYGVVCYHDGNGVSDLVTGITWNSAPMSAVAASIQVPGDRWIRAYQLGGIPLGTTNITITAGSSTALRGFALYYTGVKQTSQPDSNNSGTSTSATDFSLSTTSIADNCWTLMFGKDSSGSVTYSAGANTTIRLNTDAGGQFFTDSNAAQTPPGSFSQSVTSGTTSDRAGIIWTIAPVGAVNPTGRTGTGSLTLLGVGS